MALVDITRFKEYVGEQKSNRDPDLQMMLDAAHTAVFAHLGRVVEQVATPTPAASARLFIPTTRWLVDVDDFVSLDSLADDGTTVAVGDVQLEPLNGTYFGEYRPYSTLRRTSGSWSGSWWSTTDPSRQLVGEATVSVTAVWGWTTVPETIRLAIMMVAKDLVSSKDVAYGVQAFTEQVVVRIRENPTVVSLLAPFKRPVALVA